ncbi:ALPK2, partial [Cervus elaphus hippelaphus]
MNSAAVLRGCSSDHCQKHLSEPQGSDEKHRFGPRDDKAVLIICCPTSLSGFNFGEYLVGLRLILEVQKAATCTQNDTAVYQVSAQNCFGMICCSASVEVQSPSEDRPLSPNPKDDGHTGWKHDPETYEQASPNHTDEKEHPYKEGEGIASGPPTSADAPSSKSDGACSRQVSADRDPGAPDSENPSAVKDTRQSEEAGDAANTEGIADGLPFPNSSDAPGKQDVCGHRTVHSKVPRLIDGALDPEGPNEEALNSSHQNARVQKYISFSLPLTQAGSSAPPAARPASPPASSTDSDSDYELCPEITLTCTEEFSDDDLEYLECSDVMTDYSNAIWQRNLQGTERVFLLESDDEEMEFSECSLGGCEGFFSELGRRPPVSDDTRPMDATAGLCGHHSPPQEVGGRSSWASTRRASSLQAGMPLPPGPQQDGQATVTDPGRYKPPAASEVAEDGYPGIQGETRDSHQARKGFSGDNLLNVDKAVTETEGTRLSGESGQPGMSRCLETTAGKRVGGEDVWSRRGPEKPARTWRPGIKGKAKRLNSSLEERTAEASLNRLCPKGPVKHPLTPSDKRDSSHARAEGTDLKPQFPAGGRAVPTQAEPEAKTLQTPPSSLSKKENLHFQGEGLWVTDVFETSKVSGWSDHPQVSSETGCLKTRDKSKKRTQDVHVDHPGRRLSLADGSRGRQYTLTRSPGANSGNIQGANLSQPHASFLRAYWGGVCFSWDHNRTACGNSDERTSPDSPLFISTFTWNISQKASKCAAGENLAVIEGSTSTSASIVKAGQERLRPSHSGGLEERRPLSPDSNSSVCAKEGGDENSSPGAPDSADIPAGHSSAAKFPQEKPTTLIANVECSEVTGEKDTCALSVAPKGHPPRYLTVSVAGDSHTGGPEESSPRAPGGNTSQLPSNVPLAHVVNGSTINSSRELGHMAPSGPGIHVQVPQLPEGEGFCSSSPLQIDNLSRKKSQTGPRADTRTLGENFQEKGSETTQSVQQGSSDDNFQEILPTTSVGQVETNLVPLDCSSASTERGRQNSGLGTHVPVMAESTAKDDSRPLSHGPPLANVLLDESKESSPGYWEGGKKLKIITLEASVSETWPLGQPTDSGLKGMDAGLIPDRIRGIPDVLKAGAAVPKPGPSKTASACSPQAEDGSAIANIRKIHKREDRAVRASWSCLSSQYLSQRRFLESSSVDPVEEKKVCVTGLLPEAFSTERKENANRVSQNPDENRLERDRPAFFKQLLSCPNILESSVDPIDELSVGWARVDPPEPSESTLGAIGVENKSNDGHLDQRLEVQPAILQVPCPQQSGETPPSKNSINQNQMDRVGREAGQSHRDGAKRDLRSAILPVPGPVRGGEAIPGGCIRSHIQEGGERCSGGPGRSKSNRAALVSPALALSSGLARMTPPSVGANTHSLTVQNHDLREEDFVEPRNHQRAFSDSEERRAVKSEWKQVPSSSGLTQGPFTSSPERRGITDFSRSHRIEEHKIEEPPVGETKPTGTSGSPAGPLASVSGEHVSAKVPKMLLDPYLQGSTLGHGKKLGEEKLGPVAAQASSPPPPAVMKSQEVKEKQTPGSGHLAEGVKKKILSRVAALRLRLEEKENVRKNSVFKSPKPGAAGSCADEKGEPQRPPCQGEGRAPVLLKKIQAEMSPDHSGNVKLSCQFAEIHEDSTISWTKDSRSIAQVQRRAGDNSMVSLAILQAGQKDQGLYYCCIRNSYGKVTAEFNLTAEVLKQLSSHPDVKVYEEIEFSQLIFREDFLRDSYFGGRLHGQIATEELHFGEGVHRRAFRSKVLRGLTPVFKPGHACVLKVHNAVAYGTRNNDELVQRNYRLAAQECYVQNTARHYAQIYAAEAQPLEGFGEVP